MKLLFCWGLIFICSCHAKKPDIINTGLEGKVLPAFELLSYDSVTHFSTTSIDPNKPTILFAFQPSCPYCRAQTRMITSNASTLKDFNIYMICISQYELFKDYYKKYKLNNFQNIKAGTDLNASFVNYFKVETVPYIAIYDKRQILKKVLRGKNNVSTLRDIAIQ
jgi:thiol-disulfide isomerase/thioredoxin